MTREKIDWSQLWHPGPTRVFSHDELARAGDQRPSRTLLVIVMINMALVSMAVMQAAPPQATALLTGILAAAAVASLRLGQRLWRKPSRRRLTVYTVALTLGCGVVAVLARLRGGDAEVRQWAQYTCWGVALLASFGFWFLAVYRADQIAARLRELDERDRAIEMARQLAAAQIQPHFLFNSLASLQHWVEAKDDRAAPMLAALTGFLRATLPLFNQTRLRLGDEAQAVRQYFEVMRLRLGDRLSYRIAIEPAAAEVQVPPGPLLTLAENAIEHGVQASLAGGRVLLSAGVAAGRLTVDMRDPGAGPAADAGQGVGLANSRTRLVQAFGPSATIAVSAVPGGGGLARIECPVPTTTQP